MSRRREDGDVGIDFRRADVGVAEQFLDDPQIGAVLQQMRGETVAQACAA
jgi:hypothetical protein